MIINEPSWAGREALSHFFHRQEEDWEPQGHPTVSITLPNDSLCSLSLTHPCVFSQKKWHEEPHNTKRFEKHQLRSPHWFSQFYQIKPHGCIFEPSHISISILHSKHRFWNMNNHFKNQLYLKPEDQLKCEWSHFGVTIYINSSQTKSRKLHSFRLTKALSTVLAYSLDLSNLLLYYHNPQTCTQMLFVLFESLVLKSEGK